MRSLLLAALLVLSPAAWSADPLQHQIDVAFSPDGAAEALVVKVIDSAQNDIRMAAYIFTSPVIVKALVHARKRGVDVRLLIDEHGNQNAASTAARNALVNAGIPLRTISAYDIHHDKYIVADGLTTETGSFNFTKAAATVNSENVLVVWNNPEVAATYTRHWEDRWQRGVDVSSTY